MSARVEEQSSPASLHSRSPLTNQFAWLDLLPQGDALYAAEIALSLEKLNFQKLRDLHDVRAPLSSPEQRLPGLGPAIILLQLWPRGWHA
jgi:hypothetical protein